MQPSPKMALILQAAIRETSEGRLAWEPHSEDRESFVVPLEGVLLSVDSVDGDGLRPYRLSVSRPDDQRTPLDFISQKTGSDAWDPYSFPELEDLWYAARRVALDIEPVLDSVLAQLGGGVGIETAAIETGRPDSADELVDPWAATEEP